MKHPNIKDLKIDWKQTEKIRKLAGKAKFIKITINLEKGSLSKLRKLSASSGTPYQRLINRILKANLELETTLESRIEHLELEVKKLKKKVKISA